MPRLTWDATEEIAETLYHSYGETDPLGVSFPRLHEMITTLEGFSDDPSAVNERRLEEIQMAWYDLVYEE